MPSMRARSPKLRLGAAHFRARRLIASARPERVADIEHARDLPDLEPDIARKALVSALAGEHRLVALRMHLAREREQRRAGGVEHRAFRRSDQRGISLGDSARSRFDHGRRRCRSRAPQPRAFDSSSRFGVGHAEW